MNPHLLQQAGALLSRRSSWQLMTNRPAVNSPTHKEMGLVPNQRYRQLKQ